MTAGKGSTVCSRTGLSRPECCCPDCLQDLIRAHQPALLEPRPALGEIRITRASDGVRPGPASPGA